jgi:thiol-disulfide isomerase/thioredoxin
MKSASIVIVCVLALTAGCDWFDDPVEANLAPDTQLLDCQTAQEVLEGDDVRFVWTGSDIDGDVAGCEWSYDDGDWEPTDRDTIEIQDVARGAHTFKVRAVDDEGGVDPSPAVCSFTTSEAGNLVPRVIMVEMFTATWCRNCPEAEAALNSLMEDPGPEAICIVAYHGTPDRDVLASEETAARIDWYESDPGFPVIVGGFPTVVFDGSRFVQGARTPEEAEVNYRIEVNARKDVGSPLSIRLSGSIDSQGGDVTALVRVEDRLPEGSLVLNLVVIEDHVAQWGPWTSVYDFVTRDILQAEEINVESVGDSVSVERQFTLGEGWIPDNMDVIAFVQDSNTKEILQSGRLGAATGH